MTFKNPAGWINRNNGCAALEEEHKPGVVCSNYVPAGEMLVYSHALRGVCVMVPELSLWNVPAMAASPSPASTNQAISLVWEGGTVSLVEIQCGSSV